MRFEIRQGDITEQPDLDAIVNAANTDLVMGAGVAGAIRRRGGDGIDREAQAKGPVRLGEAVWTTAGRLPNRYVIHAAAMVSAAREFAGTNPGGPVQRVVFILFNREDYLSFEWEISRSASERD